MTVYIGNDLRCYTSAAHDRLPAETGFFDGKCKRFIEGYRFIPAGQSWTRSDGTVFTGEMISPAEDSRILEAAQTAYEQAQAENADALAALDVLGVSK